MARRRTFDPDHCTACGDFLPCGNSWLPDAEWANDWPGLPVSQPECCASGRCEVCTPGFDWGRDG